ncbi:MAG TPA: NYN domain-containing protein [Actinomycetota bacterium]|nr:NYN domain-containing protein [Actinomycetota bacterium]
MAIPDAAVPLLVKGLGAYMKGAPALDLPPDLRRLRNFHQKMLMAHSAEIVGLLEDETARGLVLQWLDDAQGLPKKQERAVRLAAERGDGWEEALAELAGGERAPAGPDPEQRLRDALQRETDKTAAAKEETKRVKESSRKSLDDERATSKELRRELEAARRELAANAAAAAAAREEAERALADAHKLERRARKDVAAAEAREKEATQQLKAARKDLAAARRRISELELALEKAAASKRPRAAAATVPSGPRRPLPVPQGRFEDDPLTLDAWLDAPGVHLLVDGYNVTKSPAGFPDLDLPSQRERLIEQLEKLALRKNVPTTVVFDGSDVAPGRSRLARTRVRVEYSRPGEIADDHLMAKLASLPPFPVVLVTGDKELQERAGGEGATIAVAEQLLELAR